MRKASQIQFFFKRLRLMVAALAFQTKPTMQYLRHSVAVQRPIASTRALITALGILTVVVSATSANAENTNKRWYRYYDDRGIPMISGSVSEQHMQHGYDILDNTLNVIRHVPPFSTSKYAQEEAQRNQAIERRIADRHLVETYVSAARAQVQRDRELSDLDSQISRSELQSESLTNDLNGNINSAARFERQGQTVPTNLRNQLNKNRTVLAQSDANVAALKAKRNATEQQFNKDITSLKRIEQQGGSAALPTSAPQP
jgi:hypothetical protein